MNYELAKGLKEAGFPHEWSALVKDPENFVFPTLSELIEACGEKFKGLSRMSDNPEKNRWVAFAVNGECAFPTAVEAVAHLWLLSNKK